MLKPLLRPSTSAPVLGDIALLVGRVALGVILVAHGWQKFDQWTVSGTAASFADMGVPAASAAATVVTFVELVGGAALILGVLTPLFALLGAGVMLGALAVVHLGNGMFVTEGGYELVLAIAAGLLVLATIGGGRLSVDGAIARS